MDYKLTNILVTSAHKNLLINPEDVSSRKTIGPPSSCQITEHRGLGVRLVFVGLCSVASVETNLR